MDLVMKACRFIVSVVDEDGNIVASRDVNVTYDPKIAETLLGTNGLESLKPMSERIGELLAKRVPVLIRALMRQEHKRTNPDEY